MNADVFCVKLKRKEENEMNKIRVAFVGIGGYGGVILNEIFQKPMEGFEIVAAVDPFPEKSACFQELRSIGIPIYSDIEKMFAENEKLGKKPDFVVIATPIQYHTRQILTSVRHGAHVLCEKPMTGDIGDLSALEKCAKESDRLIAIGYQWSYSNAIQKLKADVMQGVFGKALHLKCMVCWPRTRAYFTRSTGWAGKIYSSDGTMIRDSIVNNATAHYIHNILYILGEQIDTSAAATEIKATLLRANNIETFDTATVRFGLVCGGTGMFVVSHSTRSTVDPTFEYAFEKCKVIYPNDSGCIEAHFADGRKIIYGDPFAEGASHKFYICLQAIKEKKSAICGVFAAKQQVRFVAALHEHNKIIDVKRDATEIIDDVLTVKGLDRMLEKCYAEDKLLEELSEFKSIAELKR